MVVIKATLRDETRRLSFDARGFPPYEEVQEKVSRTGWRRLAGGNCAGATAADATRMGTTPPCLPPLAYATRAPPRYAPVCMLFDAACTAHRLAAAPLSPLEPHSPHHSFAPSSTFPPPLTPSGSTSSSSPTTRSRRASSSSSTSATLPSKFYDLVAETTTDS